MTIAALYEEFAALEARLTAIERHIGAIAKSNDHISDQLAQLCWSIDRGATKETR
ncbi:hypothetical protein GCM10011374_03220 [Kocuria dechangensis]|uniref:Uncharacterized protein n=1 Tax=Kocuria dechangensis TaxID=1176249 RepID=A0A917GFZ1_9MICC|nr:hypothetical protein [Kocuria dechangensis]GGG44266.1 hypothetical protein GCM10011374_03220 [Kocuria dechangensis]